jgi:hypothetical protein
VLGLKDTGHQGMMVAICTSTSNQGSPCHQQRGTTLDGAQGADHD